MQRLWLNSLLVLGLLAGSAAHAYEDQLLDSMDISNKFAFVIADGYLRAGEDREFARVMARYNDRGLPVAILLSSGGGTLGVTQEIAKVINQESDRLHRRFMKHNIFVINDQCFSSCTVLVAQITGGHDPQALDMIVTADSTWGFHRPVEWNGHQVREITNPTALDNAVNTLTFDYREAGVSLDWLHKNADMFIQPRKTMIKGGDLCKQSSHLFPDSSCVPAQEDISALLTSKLAN